MLAYENHSRGVRDFCFVGIGAPRERHDKYAGENGRSGPDHDCHHVLSGLKKEGRLPCLRWAWLRALVASAQSEAETLLTKVQVLPGARFHPPGSQFDNSVARPRRVAPLDFVARERGHRPRLIAVIPIRIARAVDLERVTILPATE